MSISKMAVKKPTTVLIIFMLLAALGIYCTSPGRKPHRKCPVLRTDRSALYC